jgi:hypothetical protein
LIPCIERLIIEVAYQNYIKSNHSESLKCLNIWNSIVVDFKLMIKYDVNDPDAKTFIVRDDKYFIKRHFTS